MLRAMRHADPLERFLDALPAFSRTHTAIGQWELDVVEDREVANQIEILKDESNLTVSRSRPPAQREIRHRLPVQPVLSTGWRVEQAEDRQQRRLAAARRPGNRHIFATCDLKVDSAEGMCLDLVGVKHLFHSIELYQCLIHGYLSRTRS